MIFTLIVVVAAIFTVAYFLYQKDKQSFFKSSTYIAFIVAAIGAIFAVHLLKSMFVGIFLLCLLVGAFILYAMTKTGQYSFSGLLSSILDRH